MKFFLFLSTAFIISAAYFKVSQPASETYTTGQQINTYKSRIAIACSPSFSTDYQPDTSVSIPLMAGWGNYRMPVTATNDSAAIYFEQGINMYYGFHIIEAMASFEKATRFDSSFAMGYWGQALSFGPNINDIGYTASPAAITAVNRAKQYSGRCTNVEKALINAMLLRYSNDSTEKRIHLDQLYADAMKKVYEDFPSSPDAAALFVDALMVQHPWNYYTATYEPKPWTPLIVNTLEKTLKKFPRHPGAMHYYIHGVEASAHPEKALAVADKLPGMMPASAHLVHMPSHIYIRSGYYHKGVQVNKAAVKSYYNSVPLFPSVANNTSLYLIHNLHMQATCANMDGKYGESWQSSLDCKNSFDSSWQDMEGYNGVYMQYLYMTPYLTLIRFGKWDKVLATPKNSEAHVFASMLWHYGRGMAFARKHDLTNASKQLSLLQQCLKDSQMFAPAPSYSNPGVVTGSVAEKILQGVIAEEENNYSKSAELLRTAVQLEDNMVYNEPKDWVHPARQYLGNVLLKAGNYKEAAKVFREDLTINPNNLWSLTGLASSLVKAGQTEEAAKIKLKAAKALSGSDVKIDASVF